MRIASRQRRAHFAVAMLLLVALPASSAHASAYSQVLQSYEQAGAIAPCKFSSAQLSSALKGVDTYGAQYFADFTNAIQTALTARASGECATGRPLTANPAPSPGLREPAAGSVRAATRAGTPAPILILAVVAGLLGLAGILAAVARTRGWDPAWASSWRHAWAEAGWRASATWDEFKDWRRSASSQ